MNTTFRLIAHVLLCAGLATSETALAQEKEIPELLKPWEGWVVWGDRHQDCPTPYNSGQEHICFWPSRLLLSADPRGGTWNIAVRVFEQTWVPLPGSDELWPMNVRANGDPVPVVTRDKSPAVKLPAGIHRIVGDFQWDEMPQRIAIPKS